MVDRMERMRDGAGSAALGHVTISLSRVGDLRCLVDPEWVSRREAEEVAEALNRALAAARAQYREDR